MKEFSFILLLIIFNSFKLISTKCSSGYYLTSSNSCNACPNGYYCTGGSSSPIPCPLGYYSLSSGPISQCTRCAPGYYANYIGATKCKVCPNGYFCENPEIAPTPCPTGTASVSSGGITECNKCLPGYYANYTGATSCKVCPNGYYCCDPRKPPTPCPVGTASVSSGGITECKKCLPGYYASYTGATSCKVCPNGYYCCDPRIPPTPCPVGTYSVSGGGITECKKCSPNYFTPNQGSSSCSYCSNGCPSSEISDTSSLSCSETTFESESLKCRNYVTHDNLKDLAEIGDCLFYTELEGIKKCGTNGYLINYGYKYCNKFGDNYDSFNQDGQLWVDSVRKCLINKLYENTENMNCDQLRNYAFDTHLDCYLNPGYSSKSICEIWLSKNFVGLWTVYELKDFFNQSALKQVILTIYNCAKSYLIEIG